MCSLGEGWSTTLGTWLLMAYHLEALSFEHPCLNTDITSSQDLCESDLSHPELAASPQCLWLLLSPICRYRSPNQCRCTIPLLHKRPESILKLLLTLGHTEMNFYALPISRRPEVAHVRNKSSWDPSQILLLKTHTVY